MGETTKIEWADKTFNPWIGCQKVSAGCDHCYAEAMMDHRWGKVKWGPHGERVRTSEANWKKPLAWAKMARVAGIRPRVFCASLADWLDNKVPIGWRLDLQELIEATPELDWLLLTKRPENYQKLAQGLWKCGPPANVWLGITAEDQAHYTQRYKFISRVPATARFISYEPALGPLRLDWVGSPRVVKPDWLICGGESGAHARMMDPAWARIVRDICLENDIAFFMKQMTGKAPIPPDLRIRQFPMPQRSLAA